MCSKIPVDLQFHDLREVIAIEAANAYGLLDGSQNVDVVLWETMEVAIENSRPMRRLMDNPGIFMAAIYNTYGVGEFLSWRETVLEKIKSLETVDPQG